MNVDRRIVIIGAGPAGLTAALELVRAGFRPVMIEAGTQVGGISRTIEFEGYRMDLGGHRFFSKSDWVMRWWQDIFPVLTEPGGDAVTLAYQNQHLLFDPARTVAQAGDGKVLLVRPRLSRIYHRRRFFDYPISLNVRTVLNLGFLRMLRIGAAYAWARLFPRRPEVSLEDFLINRFGTELYETFFKDYTEKVWGIACNRISAEWGAQRIKGLSITRALAHAARHVLGCWWPASRQKIETSLIEQFLYPRLGPGQLWETVAERVVAGGGTLHLNTQVVGIRHEEGRIRSVMCRPASGAGPVEIPCDDVLSTMPIRDFVQALEPAAPAAILDLATRLPYRDFLTVGLVVRRMIATSPAKSAPANGMPPDNWIYIQEPDVKLGRLQVFNNWSPDMVADPSRIFLGLEYFCDEGDALWRMDDTALKDFAAAELVKIGLIEPGVVEKGTVVRVPKAYPAYFGAYERMPEMRAFLDGFANLMPIGRNGMHRYNNQDHSMLSAKLAVDCLLNPALDRAALWEINAEEAYHEEK